MEALFGRQGHPALAGPFLQRTDVWKQRKKDRSQAGEQQIDLGMSRDPGEKLEGEALRFVRILPPLDLGDFLAQFEQNLRNLYFDRADLGASSAQAGCERKPGIARDAVKLRRDDGPNGSRVNPRIIVPADFAVHRAVI